MIRRRSLLASTAVVMGSQPWGTAARTFGGGALPFEPGAANPPEPVRPGPWQFLTAAEARAVEAITESLIPADELSVSGKDAGCAVYIDRQLSGSFGQASRAYMRPPFLPALPTQGEQTEHTPAARYRLGLAALDEFCRNTMQGKSFADMAQPERDALLGRMERGEVAWNGPVPAADLFKLLLQNTMEGFFADPVYGGNKDMVSWRMIGFPGTRYDYRDHVARHNEPYKVPPVSIAGRPDWGRG